MFPDRIFTIVDLPIPFLPSKPTTDPFFGVGRRYSLNELMPYWWILSFPNSLAKLTITIASKGHFFTQIPQPVHRSSEITAFPSSCRWTIHSPPVLFTGQYIIHSNPHFLGWHNSWSKTATLCVNSVECTNAVCSFFALMRYIACV